MWPMVQRGPEHFWGFSMIMQVHTGFQIVWLVAHLPQATHACFTTLLFPKPNHTTNVSSISGCSLLMSPDLYCSVQEIYQDSYASRRLSRLTTDFLATQRSGGMSIGIAFIPVYDSFLRNSSYLVVIDCFKKRYIFVGSTVIP